MRVTWDPKRCRVCGWTLDPDLEMCRPDNCSLRPPPDRRADATPRYTREWHLAMAVLESHDPAPCFLDRVNGDWVAMIDGAFFSDRKSGPFAICVAALLSRGIRIPSATDLVEASL
jgi:hypothetical protein